MRTYEGTIEIDLVEFWKFVETYLQDVSDAIAYGVPRVNKANGTLEIDYAGDNVNSPHDWSTPPLALKQWEELK